jgi:hypothetical protein
MVPNSEDGRLGRIESKQDATLLKISDICRIIGQHEVKICQNEGGIKDQDDDIKGLAKTISRVGVGVILLLLAAVVTVAIK